ncbi:protein phosphatase 1B isoform X4 [Apteryx rowi]|uniref:protein phosphatase 1B isoform X4 n=1 Tax=Apteryx rowi TaxID=308060 RepID=UPI000E1C79D4|nr:protein phosphatase 1B isoform X4 [Apteryx rowi]
MGAFLDKPKTEKHNAHGAGNGLRYGLSSMQGWRVEMEDAHTAVVGIPHGLEDWSFFAVYDGHAGSRVANYCSTHLLEHITNNEDFRATEKPGSALEPSVENVKSGIRTGFLKIDEYMRNFSDLRNGMDRSGSTAVGVMISPEHMYFINCGDSRAVLYRNGQVCFSTQDHKPCNPREKERIQNAGGSVMIQRVNGSLAVSRALGDYDYKCVDGKGPTEQLVSPEPEVCEILRAEEDEFIILACDGIWDVMSNEELCEFVKSRLEVSDDLEKVCNWVVDTCLHKGSRDNMSVVLVCFSNAPKVSDEAVKKDAELDKHLESRVEEIMEKSGEEGMPDLAHVIRILSAENIPNLPPGGGLAGKRNIIEAVYSRLNPHRDNEGVTFPEKSPMQWDGKFNAGFTEGNSSWLPVNPDYQSVNVEVQKTWSNSSLNLYRELTSLRNNELPIHRGWMCYIWNDSNVFVYVRELDGLDRVFMMVLNFGQESTIDLKAIVPNLPSEAFIRLSTNFSNAGKAVNTKIIKTEMGEGLVLEYKTEKPVHTMEAFQENCFVAEKACYSSAFNLLYVNC